MSARFGGDCTASSLQNRFRRIKTDAQLVNDAVRKGIDCITLDIGGPDGSHPIRGGIISGQNGFLCFDFKLPCITRSSFETDNLPAISKHFGDDCTKNAAEKHRRGVKADALRARHCVEQGRNVRTLGIGGHCTSFSSCLYFQSHFTASSHIYITTNSSSDISKYFGGDSTSGGIGFQFRAIKADAKRARACADAGGDPHILGIGGGNCQTALFLLLLVLSSCTAPTQHLPN